MLMVLIIDTMHSPIYWCNIGANVNLIRSEKFNNLGKCENLAR